MIEKPVLGITMGDPSGIGPEISVKALAREELYGMCRQFIVGDAAVMEKAVREACDRVKKDRVLKVIELAHSACKALGIDGPRVAVAGLNPHAGENGMFGNEEINEIEPAIAEAKAKGINATGPIPPDTIFSKARGEMFDIVVAMYHDQGHIPLKVVGFQYNASIGKWEAVKGVNITLGLPIIRSSVDHRTAFGHAWQGSASEASLLNAIEYGVRLAANRS